MFFNSTQTQFAALASMTHPALSKLKNLFLKSQHITIFVY